jgi:hypothetical protein
MFPIYEFSTHSRQSRASNHFELGHDYDQLKQYRRAARMYAVAAAESESLGGDQFVQATKDLVAEGNSLKSDNDIAGSKTCYLKAKTDFQLATKFVPERTVLNLKKEIEQNLNENNFRRHWYFHD